MISRFHGCRSGQHPDPKLEPNEQSHDRVRSHGIPIPPILPGNGKKAERIHLKNPKDPRQLRFTDLISMPTETRKKTLIAPPVQNKIKAGQYEGIH